MLNEGQIYAKVTNQFHWSKTTLYSFFKTLCTDYWSSTATPFIVLKLFLCLKFWKPFNLKKLFNDVK